MTRANSLFRRRFVALSAVVVAFVGCDRGGKPSGPDGASGPSPERTVGPSSTAKSGLTRALEPAKVFALLISDVAASRAVTGVTLDIDRNAVAFRALLAAGVGADRLVIVSLDGTKVAAAEIDRAIRRLPLTPNDSLICYISGVGVHDTAAPDGFKFSLHGQVGFEPLPRALLRKWLTDRNARLTVLLSDTAAGAVGVPKWPLPLAGSRSVVGGAPDVTPTEFPPLADRSATLPGYKSLLLDSGGLVDWAGAEERSSAWGPPGEVGFFTRALARVVFDSRNDPTASWPAIYSLTKSETEVGFSAWRAAETSRLRTNPKLSPDESLTLRLLNDQQRQSSRAYYLPGTPLKMITRDADGKGARVAELPLDSPCRAAGIQTGEIIVAVQGQPTKSVKEWTAIAGPAIRSGEKRLTFRVRSDDGRERDAVVQLPI